MTSPNVTRLLELKTKLQAVQPIDGWRGFRLNKEGEVLAGKWENGKSLTNKFKPEGEWKLVAERLKLLDEFQLLFGTVTNEEFDEYLKSK